MATTTIYTTKQVAFMFDCTPARVKQLAGSHHVGRRIGRQWIFTMAEIEKMRVRKKIMAGQTRLRAINGVAD